MKDKDLRLKAAQYVLGGRIESLAQLSDEQLDFFASIQLDALKAFFAQQDLLCGESTRKIAIRYGVSQSKVCRIASAQARAN